MIIRIIKKSVAEILLDSSPFSLLFHSMGKKQSQRQPQQQQGPLIQRIPTKKPPPQDDIAESEKMRLMQQAGLLDKVKKREAEIAAENIGTAVYIWQAIFMCIPFGLLVGAFDVTVKVQYSEPWNYIELLIRSCKAMPGNSKRVA